MQPGESMSGHTVMHACVDTVVCDYSHSLVSRVGQVRECAWGGPIHPLGPWNGVKASAVMHACWECTFILTLLLML
jgi:hypothetical protein